MGGVQRWFTGCTGTSGQTIRAPDAPGSGVAHRIGCGVDAKADRAGARRDRSVVHIPCFFVILFLKKRTSVVVIGPVKSVERPGPCRSHGVSACGSVADGAPDRLWTDRVARLCPPPVHRSTRVIPMVVHRCGIPQVSEPGHWNPAFRGDSKDPEAGGGARGNTSTGTAPRCRGRSRPTGCAGADQDFERCLIRAVSSWTWS